MQRTAIALGTAALVMSSVCANAAFADGDDYKEILEDRSESIVKVKLVMNMSMGGQDREIPMEAPGVILSKDGLVMVPGSALELELNMGGGRGRGS